MSEILGKLTNLSYEFFGVLLPGVITSIFIIYVWLAMGDMTPLVTRDFVPALSFSDLLDGVDSLTTERGIGALILLILGWYFLGHIVLWVSRSNETEVPEWPKSFKRTWLALTFRFPKPNVSYEARLKELLDEVGKKLEATPGQLADWRMIYPVAKNYLAQNVQYSLVATYQHKYTLHRSVSGASVLFFWALAVVALCACCGSYYSEPRWVLILFGMVWALVFVWGFSDSFMYNWKMFGNTIISECYALFFGPK